MSDIPRIGAQETVFQKGGIKPSEIRGGSDPGIPGTIGLNDGFVPAQAFALAQPAMVTFPSQASPVVPPPPRVDRAVLYEHNSDGTFTATTKIPCEEPDEIIRTGQPGGKTAGRRSRKKAIEDLLLGKGPVSSLSDFFRNPGTVTFKKSCGREFPQGGWKALCEGQCCL